VGKLHVHVSAAERITLHRVKSEWADSAVDSIVCDAVTFTAPDYSGVVHVHVTWYNPSTCDACTCKCRHGQVKKPQKFWVQQFNQPRSQPHIFFSCTKGSHRAWYMCLKLCERSQG
jgi:hypothetical protein